MKRLLFAGLAALLLAVSAPGFAGFGTGSFGGPDGFSKSAPIATSGWCNLIPQSGLVNCWPYDTANTTSGTATDVIGGKNSTQTNITLNGSGPSSHLNNSIACNGTSSRGDTTLANLPTAAFSVVAWVNPTTTVQNGRYMANDHTDSDNKAFQALTNTGGVIYVGNGTSNVSTNAGSVTTSTWQMVTFTYDGTTLKSYLNTAAGGSGAFTGPLSAGTNNISFCVNPAYSGDWYHGSLAGVAVYNRALSPSEITTINGL